MTDSILDTVKAMVNVPAELDAFDAVLIVHTNTAFSNLNQLGIGPDDGFEIVDNTAVWATFLGGNLKLNSVKSYIGLRVVTLFDPSQNAHVITAQEKVMDELVFRINVEREQATWVPPTPRPECHPTRF